MINGINGISPVAGPFTGDVIVSGLTITRTREKAKESIPE